MTIVFTAVSLAGQHFGSLGIAWCQSFYRGLSVDLGSLQRAW